MDTNKHELKRNAAVVEDPAAARGNVVPAATGAAHTVALPANRIRVHWCLFVV